MVTLPIMFMTGDQYELEQLGIEQECTVDNSDIRMVIFYHINCIYPSTDKNITYVLSNGDRFCCPKEVNQVHNLITGN